MDLLWVRVAAGGEPACRGWDHTSADEFPHMCRVLDPGQARLGQPVGVAFTAHTSATPAHVCSAFGSNLGTANVMVPMRRAG